MRPRPQATQGVQDDAQAQPATALQAFAEPALHAAGLPVGPGAALPWLGLQWLGSFASPATPGHHPAAAPRILTDPETGARSLNLPLPDPAAVARLDERLTGLLARFKR